MFFPAQFASGLHPANELSGNLTCLSQKVNKKNLPAGYCFFTALLLLLFYYSFAAP
jgi:hypothetical protein